jgi:nucleotide-binding universal stress UspA family protein
MFSRILIPVDGSSFAEHALPYAVHAVRVSGAELAVALVHVRHTPATTDPGLVDALAEWDDAQAARESAYIEEFAARAGRDGAGFVVPRLLRGDVVPALEAEIRDRNVDLVVMTTHGRAGVERAWLGSVADALVRHIDVPLLLIRPSDNEPVSADGAVRYSHVVIGLDGSERAERAMTPALALAGSDARVSLVRVASPPSAVMSPYLPHAAQFSREELESRQAGAAAYLEDAAARLRGEGVNVTTAVPVDYHAARGILDYAVEHQADLIAVGTHGRSRAARLIMGSVSDKIVRAASVPVLVC